MTSQSGKQKILIHILSNVSRSKRNQAMILGQLMENNKRKIFLKKCYTKCDRETIPKPFSNKSKLSISLGDQCKFLYSLFSLYIQVKSYQNIFKPNCGPLDFSS